jgi:hypothetical protein
MEEAKLWCTKKCKKVKSVDLLIRRRSSEPVKRSSSVPGREVLLTPKKVGTPKRRVRVLSPSSYVEIRNGPATKKYSSIRKIDFSS